MHEARGAGMAGRARPEGAALAWVLYQGGQYKLWYVGRSCSIRRGNSEIDELRCLTADMCGTTWSPPTMVRRSEPTATAR